MQGLNPAETTHADDANTWNVNIRLGQPRLEQQLLVHDAPYAPCGVESTSSDSWNSHVHVTMSATGLVST